MVSTDCVVFVGRRAGALAAAFEVGVSVVELLPAPASRTPAPVVASHVVDWHAPDTDWNALAGEFMRGGAPAAVIATTEDSVLPAARLRDALDLSSGDVEVALRCADKALMKRTISEHGIACTDFVAGDGRIDSSLMIAALGLPIYIKPRLGSGGRNTRCALTREDLPAFLGTDWLAERAIDGTELSVEGFIVDGTVRFCNLTEYLEPGWASVVPASFDALTRNLLHKLLQRSVTAVGIDCGMVHMEAFLTDNGPLFGEMAWRPPGGYLMELISAAYGFDAWRVWLAVCRGEMPSLPASPAHYAGARIVHPGAGKVGAVHGLDAARAVDGIARIRLRAKPGKVLTPRTGTGQEAGHIIAVGQTREAVTNALARAQGLLHIELDQGTP